MANLHSFKNNAIGLVQNNPLASGGTNLIVNNALDTQLQTLTFPFWLTLWHAGTSPDTDSLMEIVNVTARVSPNNYTITRAQQGTSAQSFAQNSNVGLLWTAGNAAEIIDSTSTVGKGYIIVYNASGLPILLPVGSNGLALIADSTQTLGVKWDTPPNPITYAQVQTTKNINDADATQTIPHLLGKQPAKIRISVVNPVGGFSSFFSSNTTTNCEIHVVGNSSGGGTTIKIYSTSPGGSFNVGTVTSDATNVYIAWVNTGNPTGTVAIMLETEG